MSGEQHNTKHAMSGEPRPKGLFARVHSFFDTKVGFALLTFLLTSGLGTFATWLLTDVQQVQASRSVALQARAAELASLHTGVEANILQREVAADNYIRAIEVGAGDSEVGELWQKYEEAANGEILSALQSHLVIMGHTQDGPDPGLFDRKAWRFWTYLSDVIQPRFASMHDCLLDVHNAYVAAGEPLFNRLAKARVELKLCKKDSDWDRFAYTFDPAVGNSSGKNGNTTKTTVSVSEWDDFKTCVEDYTYLLDLSTRLEARAVQYEHIPIAGHDWDGCSSSDDMCRLTKFLDSLPATLPRSCGSLDKDYE